MTNDKKYDLVFFGATGYVGGLTIDYLARNAPAGLRLAVAGRNAHKVAGVVAECAAVGLRVDALSADAGDVDSLTELADLTRVLVTTVGPYTEHGMALATACARSGTDYADLTGEPLFVRESIAANHDLATRAGARIVHSSGFDSVPSDLSVRLLHERVTADGAGELGETVLVVRRIRGGISGGTAASGLAHGRTMAHSSATREAARDPYTHSHRRGDEPDLGPQPDGRLVALNTVAPGLNGWGGGFFMAPHNTRVVRRSNTLTDWSYGRRFKYSEVMAFPGGPLSVIPAAVVAAGLAGSYASSRLLNAVPESAQESFLPRRGGGPSARGRSRGHFTFETYAHTTDGSLYRATFAMVGDPGYAATAVILGESALALALDRDDLCSRGGVLTPAVAMGRTLPGRLVAAGTRIDVERIRRIG